MTDRILSALGYAMMIAAAYFLWIATPAWAADGAAPSAANDWRFTIAVFAVIVLWTRFIFKFKAARVRFMEDSED